MSENEDFTQYFDAPVIEPVRGIGDVKFDRATFDYFAGWATLLNTKRFNEDKADIDKMVVSPVEKAEATARARRKKVQIFEVLDQQFTFDGIDKILKDAFVRAGAQETEWPKVKKRIGPVRLQQIAAEVCAEPTPTINELRQSLREMLKKAHKSAVGVETMSDEELMKAVREFEPSKPDGAGPLPGSPSGAADSGPTTNSAATSSDVGSESSQAA